jgi:beta-glucosidase
MKHFTTILFLLMLIAAGFLNAQNTKDPKMNAFVDGLMKKMTLEEKIGQLNLPGSGDIVTGQAKSSDIGKKIREGKVGALFNIKSVAKIKDVQRIAVEESRLKIPLIFGMDVIHGYESVFPIPLGLSCSWDMALIERSARIAAIEASADGINWTFSPMADIARDARWGRIAEGSGEDPFLGYQISQAMVKGYQGKNLAAENTIMACVKHYALYGAAEAGRDYNTVDMSHQRMFNDYFPPYKGAIDAGCGSVMSSFNEIDGVPASANKWLMDDVLRKLWGFNGFVVTDYTAINEMIDHGIGDLKTVSARALQAGIDMDMVGEGFLSTLQQSLKDGKVTNKQIDMACRRVLEAKYKLGLFDDPYRYCNEERAKKEIFSAEHRKIARETATQTCVLLKNNNVLPLKKSGKLALIGPLADNKENMPGTWAVAANFDKAVSLLQGMTELVGKEVKILHSYGSNLDADSMFEERAGMFGKSFKRDTRPAAQIIKDALAVANQADVIVAALGESAEMSGESSSRSNIEIPKVQRDLLEALVKTGKPVVLVLFTGRPLAINWENANVPAILNVWFPGSEAGYAITDVLFGDVNPSGKLTTSWPQNVGQLPLYYAQKNTGRPLAEGQWFQKFRSNYLDVSNDPLYPFGYGLSYTTFEYGDLKLDKTKLVGEEKLKASITVKNTGKYAGKEVVQLYIRDVVGSVTRPLKELKGFQKIELKPGESKEVTFEIGTEALMFYNYDLAHVWEEGEFIIMLGPNSKDLKSGSVQWSKRALKK